MLDTNLMTADMAIAQNAQKLPSNINVEKLDQAAQEFEAVFISEMMKPMFEGIKTDGAFGGGKGEEVFRGMLIQEYGKKMSETGNLGIADHVKAAMISMQEAAQNRGQTSNSIVSASPKNNITTETTTNDNGEKNHETPTP